MSGNYNHDLIMSGSAFDFIQIPAGYQYMSIINNTDNTIRVYQDRTTVDDVRFAIIKVPPYTQQTIPINPDRRDFTFSYTDGGAAGTKKAEIIFSANNLGIQGTLGTAISGTVTLGADGVGLARQTQLPGALGAAGGLKVERVELGRQTGKATASGDTTIKGSAGLVWAIVCVTTGVTAKLKDGASDKWAVTPATPGNFPVPIACSSSIVLNLSGAGEAYVLYE